MMKIFACCFLLCYTLFSFGQQLRTIAIDAENARSMNLSEISDKVIPVILEKNQPIVNGNVLLTNEYLFITSHKSIEQYDLMGKFIKSINCGDNITYNVTSDTIKKELYVPVGNIIKCFDYSGKLKKVYQMKNEILYILYFKGFLWIQSYYNDQFVDKGKKTIYSINKINLSTGEVIPLSFSLENINSSYGYGLGRLTRYHDDLVISFCADSTLYKIQQDDVIPVFKWNINPPAKFDKERIPFDASGFTGEYLFVNYRRDDWFYIYLENMKTGEKYNVNNVVDDVFNTDNHCEIHPLNQSGYFFFAKDKYEIKSNSIENMPLKSGAVIFIVKLK